MIYSVQHTDLTLVICPTKKTYVRVPWTRSDRSFQNSKEWVDTAIQIAGSKHAGTYEAAYRIANHLLRFYRDSVLAACENQRVPVCKEMSATQFQAMLCAAKVTGAGEKEIKKHLSVHLGKGYCPTRRSVDMLAEGHSEIHYGSLEFTYDDKDKAEFIEWTEKNIHDEICVNLQRHLTSKSVLPSDVVHIQAVVGGDHGDTAFQFGAKVSVHLRDNRIIHFEVMVCELICRKDTAKLIESTILEKNEVDILSIKRKMQREEGRIKPLEYFEEFSKEEKLTWVEIIFDDVKGGGEKNGISPSIPTKPSTAGITDNV